MDRENREVKLKRLGFARNIAVTVAIYVSNIYIYAKNTSAVLNSAVEPVYDNLKGMPLRLLIFLDNKIDKGLNKVDEHVPPSVKWAIDKAQLITQKTSLVAKTFVHKAQTSGPSAAVCYSGQIFTQLLLILLANLWYVINQITALHVVAQMAIPTIAQWSENYNKMITEMRGKGYNFFRYLPRVPKEEITKAYKQVEAERGPVCTICN